MSLQTSLTQENNHSSPIPVYCKILFSLVIILFTAIFETGIFCIMTQLLQPEEKNVILQILAFFLIPTLMSVTLSFSCYVVMYIWYLSQDADIDDSYSEV